jgi:hypothetical protein
MQWFSTFLSLRHTNFENKFGGTHKCKKETNMLKIQLFLDTLCDNLRFGGTPRKFDETLVHRGTPVEKHCSNGLKCKSVCVVLS